jgi:Domain of unknown function (DUF4124)
MRRYSTVTAFVLLAGLATGARAENIWKWVDAHGVPHYSDRPVPGAVLIKSVDADQPDTSTAADDQQPSDTSQQITAELNREEAARSVQKDEAAERAKQCEQAKTRYAKMIQARRIYTVDSKGERHYLSDDQAQKDRVQARLDVQTYCGSSAD